MTAPRAYQSLDALQQKLDDTRTERDQLLYLNQLLATDLKVAADTARGYCEERDDAEDRVTELENELGDQADHIVEIESALSLARSGKATAEAWLSLKNGGLK